IPKSLAEHFSDEQMRAVLLHELIHLRRRDVWMNFLQALVQIAYWWHPLVWMANARIRRVREEAVDDAVMVALRDEAEAYAPTLLEVAKLALNRPLVSLGLVGIMESRNALRQRIERLLEFQPPRRAGLTVVSLLGVLAFTAVAVPMGEKPPEAEKVVGIVSATPAESEPISVPATTNEQSVTVQVDPDVFVRNVKAQAGKYWVAVTNDYPVILMGIMRGEGIDSNPPHGLVFNNITGEITTQNTPENTETFRRVIDQLNRADGKCELPLRSETVRRKMVLAEARIYQIRAADFGRFTTGLRAYGAGNGSDAWWSVEPGKVDDLTGRVEAAGLQPVMRPRLQTSSGGPAQFFVGDSNSGIELDCLPYVKDGVIDLTWVNKVFSEGLTDAAITNRGIYKASAENYGGIVTRLENLGGHTESNLVVVTGLHILTNNATSQFQQRLKKIIKQVPDGADASPAYSAGHQKVIAKLKAIRLASFGPFDGETLEQVVRHLGEAVKSQNTNQENIQFTVAGPDTNRPALLDPNTGLPAKEPSSLLDARVMPIHLKTPLKDMTVADILDEVVKAAGPGVKYSISDDGVQFSARKPDDAVMLMTRTYKMDTQVYVAALKSMGMDIIGGTNSSKQISEASRKFFANLGVDLEKPAGKAIFFNDKNGLLFVKAAQPDQDIIERAIQALNQIPPQLHIKARFLQVPRGTVAGLGSMVSSTNATTAEFTGIVDDAKLRAMLHSFEAQKGFEALGEPEVTTLSGRQCQMRATETITVISNMVFQAGPTNGNGPAAISPQTLQFEAGPILDVVPYVLADGYTINLTVTPTLNEFLGYDSGPGVQNVTGTNNMVQLPVFFPHFNRRQMTATLNLRDNQTVIIGGMPEVKSTTHKVPVLGSVPLMGRMFRSENTTTNEILVLITATIVDPAGMRVHSEAELSHLPISAAPDVPNVRGF
ncbi:MAG TPA: M56 family metallopeptidase, partial [Verrucomicrobiae bacterium]|nr:M56 family metallopeptidase [Verrucomicrobiae bacterium]